MPIAEELVALLLQVLEKPLSRDELVRDFQLAVTNDRLLSISEKARTVFRELAYDLSFFELRPSIRAEDQSLYGHKRLEAEIREALDKLREAGIWTPNAD